MNSAPKTILAIESAIRGGSISLIREDREIAYWIGSNDVSKAEDLLVNIDVLLRGNAMTMRDIQMVAVSAGPGSFTGIRIGIATALGLKTGLNIPMSSISALDAIANGRSYSHETVVALPIGRNAICRQRFARKSQLPGAVSEPETIPTDTLADEIRQESDPTYLLHSSLYSAIPVHDNVVDIGANLANAIGMACARNPGIVAEPLFISKNW